MGLIARNYIEMRVEDGDSVKVLLMVEKQKGVRTSTESQASRPWQREKYRRPLTRRTFHPDGPAVLFNELLAQD